MQQTFRQTLNEKCYARIYTEKGKIYVEWLGMYVHKHLIKKCKTYDEAVKIYEYSIA